LKSDWSDGATAQLALERGLLNGILANRRAGLLDLFRSYGQVMGVPNIGSTDEFFNRFYRWCVDTGVRVTSRGFTFDSSPTYTRVASSTGQLVRVTTDAEGFDIETAHAEAKTFRCVADVNMVRAYASARFEVIGGNAGRDELGRSASAVIGEIQEKQPGDSLLVNAGLRQSLAGGTVPGWTWSGTVSSDLSLDTSNPFRRIPEDGDSPSSLSVVASGTLSQSMRKAARRIEGDTRPYLTAVAWNRQIGSFAGDIDIAMGAVTLATITASAQTGWVVSLIPGTFGANNWYKAFREIDMDLTIQVTRTSGTLKIGEVLFVPMDQLDSTYYAFVPGSAAAHVEWALNDTIVITDSISSDSILQRHFAEGCDRYAPHTTGSGVTWAEPS